MSGPRNVIDLIADIRTQDILLLDFLKFGVRIIDANENYALIELGDYYNFVINHWHGYSATIRIMTMR